MKTERKSLEEKLEELDSSLSTQSRLSTHLCLANNLKFSVKKTHDEAQKHTQCEVSMKSKLL